MNPATDTELKRLTSDTADNMQTDSRTASAKAVVCKELLGCVESDLAPIKATLTALSAKYRAGGEDRIGWEILQSIRALDEATHLAGVYLSGKPLPTLAEMRGIFKKHERPKGKPMGCVCNTCGEQIYDSQATTHTDEGLAHLECQQAP